MTLLASFVLRSLADPLLMADGLPAGAARGTSASRSAEELSALGVHLVNCNVERGQLFSLRASSSAVIGLLPSRVITVMVAFVSLYAVFASVL